MRKLIYLFLITFLMVSCEKEREVVSVKYKVSNAYSPINLKYKNAEGSIISETVNFASAEDKWQYEFDEKRGEIVYISGSYSDSTSSAKIIILIDGKVYKQGSSDNEPYKYITVSGTIPY